MELVLGQLLDDRQAQAPVHRTGRGVDLAGKAGSEHLSDPGGRDAPAVVRHLEAEAIPLPPSRDGQVEAPSGPGGLDGVVEQVAEDGHEIGVPGGIAVVLQTDGEDHVLPRRPGGALHAPLQHVEELAQLHAGHGRVPLHGLGDPPHQEEVLLLHLMDVLGDGQSGVGLGPVRSGGTELTVELIGGVHGVFDQPGAPVHPGHLALEGGGHQQEPLIALRVLPPEYLDPIAVQRPQEEPGRPGTHQRHQQDLEELLRPDGPAPQPHGELRQIGQGVDGGQGQEGPCLQRMEGDLPPPELEEEPADQIEQQLRSVGGPASVQRSSPHPLDQPPQEIDQRGGGRPGGEGRQIRHQEQEHRHEDDRGGDIEGSGHDLDRHLRGQRQQDRRRQDQPHVPGVRHRMSLHMVLLPPPLWGTAFSHVSSPIIPRSSRFVQSISVFSSTFIYIIQNDDRAV